MAEQRGCPVAILEVEATVILSPDILAVASDLDKCLLVEAREEVRRLR